jgi:hypothetical protein
MKAWLIVEVKRKEYVIGYTGKTFLHKRTFI